MLENCLFGEVKLTKNSDIDKFKYCGYGIGFDRKGKFSFGNEFGQNAIIFGANISSSVHANNKTRSTLVLDDGFTQGLDYTALYAEKMYSINISKTNTKFCLSLHYNGANSCLFVNATEIYKFRAKDSENVENSHCLENISEDFPTYNMKKTGLYGYVYDFSIEYNPIATDDIVGIYKYLMEQNNIK